MSLIKLDSRFWRAGNEKGMVTAPFLLVSFIILFFILSFFIFAVTLVHVSATQYMSYSAARRLALGNITKGEDEEPGLLPTAQKGAANAHYISLRNKLFGQAHTDQEEEGALFIIQSHLGIHTQGQQKSESIGLRLAGDEGQYAAQDDYLDRFYGVTVNFAPKMLNLKIPFLIQDPEMFEHVGVASFLGREPSQEECEQFNERRWQWIKNKYQARVAIEFRDSEKETKGDNGC